ncbi:MAG: hypothetical protein ABID61_00050 [Candidatus Micrarchaeota archaeon]
MNLTARASEARDKMLRDTSGSDFSSVKYAAKWKTRLDDMLEHKQKLL